MRPETIWGPFLEHFGGSQPEGLGEHFCSIFEDFPSPYSLAGLDFMWVWGWAPGPSARGTAASAGHFYDIGARQTVGGGEIPKNAPKMLPEPFRLAPPKMLQKLFKNGPQMVSGRTFDTLHMKKLTENQKGGGGRRPPPLCYFSI